MKSGKRESRTLLALVSAAMALSGGLSPRSFAADLQKVRVSMAAQTATYAPYLIAIAKGYYSDEGLALDVQMATGGTATPAQLAGSIDINTSGPVALSPILRGAPMKIVYTEATHSDYQLWSSSHDLKSLNDLKGLQVGILSRGDTFEISTKLALLSAGLPLDWVGYTALGGSQNLLPAFIARSLPAVILTSLDVAEGRRRDVLKRGQLIADMMHDLPMPYSGIAVTDAYLKDHTGVVKGFLRATMKGVRYMKAFKAQTVAIVVSFNKNPNPETDEVVYDGVIPHLTSDGTMPDDVLERDMEVRASIIGVPKEKIPPVSRAYDYRLVREANSELDKSGWVPQP